MHSPDPVERARGQSDDVAKMGDVAAQAGIERIHMIAWRDIDDPEAGGSEIHADRIARLWSEAGIEVTLRTSFAVDHPTSVHRDGYRVIRKGGRYMVFPRAAVSETLGWHGPRDALVEIWNGMPFFSPLWATGPRVVFLHHHHAEMWNMTLPPHLARLGRFVESRLAPPIYRRSSIVTLSESSKQELVHEMGFRAEQISVVPPGIDRRYAPGEARSPTPLVVAVGRLVPVKRFHLLIEALAEVRRTVPNLEAVIVGEGYEREALEAQRAALGAEEWLELPGRIRDDELVSLYRRAWAVASCSAREGWGMTLTEAAACGTPAVVTRIAGHVDAVIDGQSGIVVDRADSLADGLCRLLGDDELREHLTVGAVERAQALTWEATALETLRVVARDAASRRAKPAR